MQPDAIGMASGGWAGLGVDSTLSLVALVAVGLLVAAAMLSAILLLSRNRLARDGRQVVRALEELRSGHARQRVELESGSSLSLVADAVNRLGQDLQARTGEQERAQQRLDAVMEAFRDSAVVSTDLDGDLQTASEGALALFGREEHELLGEPSSILFAEGQYERFLPKLARKAVRERGLSERARLARKDGREFPAELTIRTMQGHGGQPVGFLVVIRDVSREEAMAADLRRSEARHRGLVEGLGEAVLIVQAGEVLYANPEASRLTGLPVERIVGRPLRDRVATRDLLTVEEALAELERKGDGRRALVCRLAGAPEKGELVVRVSAVATEHDGRPAVLLLLVDESGALQAETELRRNESRLDAVLEAASDGILVLTDRRGHATVHVTNRAFLELTGLSQDRVLGRAESELLAALRGRGNAGARIADMIRGAGSKARVQELTLGGTEPRAVRVSVSRLLDRAGRAFGRIVVLRDRTEQRESERKLQQHAEQLQLGKVMLEQAYRRIDAANRDLRRRGEELDRLNRELQTLDEMKTKLLGNVSHELQTPLVSIRGYTEMILKERLGPINHEQRKGLKLSLDNIDRLISMIDNILVFTRSEPDLGRLTLTSFPLDELLAEATALLQDKMDARSIGLEVQWQGDPPAVRADRDKVLQVFINLLSNAVKFNREGGGITIRARPVSGGLVEVRVEDTGIGIPSDALGKIFDRHYQVDRGDDVAREGSGIGLSIVQDILRLHGCRIRVTSEPDRGTRFEFTLPAAAEVRRDDEAEPVEPVEPAVTEPPAHRPASEVILDDSVFEEPEDESGEGGASQPRFRIIRPDNHVN